MATCAECVHVEVCSEKNLHVVVGMNIIPRFKYKRIEQECKNFKDHSRFVDIAEVKRKIIRPLCNRCAALTDCQTCPACALEIREHCEHYKEAEQAVKERNSE